MKWMFLILLEIFVDNRFVDGFKETELRDHPQIVPIGIFHKLHQGYMTVLNVYVQINYRRICKEILHGKMNYHQMNQNAK